MIPVIIDILEEDNDYLRESTVNFLSCFPAESHVILPHLKRILKNDEDSSVRIATAGAILKLDPDHPDTDTLDYIISIFFGKYPYSWDVPYVGSHKIGWKLYIKIYDLGRNFLCSGWSELFNIDHIVE